MDANTPGQAPADGTDTSAGKLAAQAADNMRTLTAQLLDSLKKQSASATANYFKLLHSAEQTAVHQYNVFQVATPHRYLVLRDVYELNGAPPVYPAGAGTPPVYPPTTFASALAWVNGRMLDGVGRPSRAKPPGVN